MKPLWHVATLLVLGAALQAQDQDPRPPRIPALFQSGEHVEAGDLSVQKNQVMPSQDPADLPAFSVAEDGSKWMVLKFGFPGAAGVRLQLDSFHLAPGASVFFRSEDRYQRFGPFELTGPTGLGEFQSPPVAGDSIYLEFRVTGDVPALLPFHVERVSPVTKDELDRFAAPLPLPVGEDGDQRTSFYHGIPLTHQVKGGLAIYEGDIVLGNARDLPPAGASHGKSGMRQESFGITAFPASLWPGGVVPYTIDPSITSPSTVVAAAAMWNNATSPTITVIPRTSQSNYVNFVRWSTSGVCQSWIGMVGGAQSIYVGDYCGAGDLAHEIGHAVGLIHEHARVDRDTYVTINWANIVSTYLSNFQIPTYGTDINSFDYNSIMFYPTWAFSSNGQPTITTIPAGIPIGQRSGLSAGDIAGALRIYATAPPANVTITLATNPAGLLVSVDGVSYVAPKAFTAPAGSVHVISTPSPQGTPSTRYVFAKWSNYASQTFTLTMPTSSVTLTASFSTQYQVTAAAGAGGTVSVSPAASGGFYAANSSVTFAATPSSGYCFASWTGLNPGAPATTAATVTKPVSATANFAPCVAVTLATNPPNLSVGVGGASYSAPKTVTAAAGTLYSLSTASPQGSGSTQYVFANWSNGSAQSFTLTVPASASTLTASFTTRYLVSAMAGTGGTVSLTPAASDGFYPTNSTVAFAATPSSGYCFANWTGLASGAPASSAATVTGPVSATANFTPCVTFTLATNPPNLSVTVGGVSYSAPKTVTAPAGTVYSISTAGPQGSGSTRYVFANWSNGSPQSFTLAMPPSTTTLTANFITQYQVTVAAGAGGTVSMGHTASGGFFSAKSSLNIVATPSAGFCFANWTGLNPGTPAAAAVIVTAPISATANFIPCG